MTKPHKWAALIKAWADGKEIEGHHRNWPRDLWRHELDPDWNDPDYEFRLRPKPKPDEVVMATAYRSCVMYHDAPFNLKLTFDGETGQLKSAEVLK